VRPEWRDLPLSSLQKLDLPVYTITGAFILVSIALVIALAVWAISTLAHGALIAGASAADSGRETSFGEAFGQAWRRWTGAAPAAEGALAP
jgi:hypothetical protein